MKGLTLLLLVVTAHADLNGFKPMLVPPQDIDRQGISYSTNVYHPDPNPNSDHPQHEAQSTVDVTFGSTSAHHQDGQESRVSNVFNKDYYIPPKTVETYQQPLQYQNHPALSGGVLTASGLKVPDSQLFNVGYSVKFTDGKKNLKKSVYNRQPEGDIITGTRKGQETVQKPSGIEWTQQQQQRSDAPAVEIIKSDELSIQSSSNLQSQEPQQFDHANALGRSIGFDFTNGMEGTSPIYKKYVRPGGTLEKKAEHYFNKQPLRLVHLQTAASGAAPVYEKAGNIRNGGGEGQESQLAQHEPSKASLAKFPLDTRLIRNPVLLTDSSASYKNDPNIIPIHFDTRQLQETMQNEHQQQPFAFVQQQQQQQYLRNQPQLAFASDPSQQQSIRAYSPKVLSLEKRGGFKKELGPRQPRYTPRVQIQTHLRPPPQIYQRKVLVAKHH